MGIYGNQHIYMGGTGGNALNIGNIRHTDQEQNGIYRPIQPIMTFTTLHIEINLTHTWCPTNSQISCIHDAQPEMFFFRSRPARRESDKLPKSEAM